MTDSTPSRLCSLAELTESKPLRVELPALDVAVVKVGDEVFVLEDLCSHAEYELSEGEVTGCTIECELHGSRFDLRTGRPTGPPATEPVAVFSASVVGGEVCADLDHPLEPSES